MDIPDEVKVTIDDSYISKVEAGDMVINLGEGYGKHLIITGTYKDIVAEKIRDVTMREFMENSFTWEHTIIENNIECENYLDIPSQKTVLPDLIKNNPKTQFVVTTFSPFIINSVSDAVVVNLDTGAVVSDLSGYSYSCLIESFFNSDEYSHELTKKVYRFDELVNKDELSNEEREAFIHLESELYSLPKYANDALVHKLQQLKLKFRHKIQPSWKN